MNIFFNSSNFRAEPAEMPTKCVASQETVTVAAQIVHIDFEGRTDGESLRRILKEIKPRQLIVVRGPPEARQNLRNYFENSKELCAQGRIFVPDGMETVDATTESHIYQVKLLDSLVSSLAFSRARDTEIAWIDAQIAAQPRDGDQDLGSL